MRGDDHTTTKVLSTPEEYNRIIHDEDVMINHVYTSENKIAVVYKSKNDSKKKICKKSNVVIAAFVTSHARVMLHRGLCSIKDPNRLLYSDTGIYIKTFIYIYASQLTLFFSQRFNHVLGRS